MCMQYTTVTVVAGEIIVVPYDNSERFLSYSSVMT